MSLASRDQEAYDLVARRAFGGAYLVALELELQTRRLTVQLYGALRTGSSETFLATVTFFGARGLDLENAASEFPESARVASLTLSYREAEEEGSVAISGQRAWQAGWAFDGLAYEEHPAVVASLADDD